jgi:hypothetical protein
MLEGSVAVVALIVLAVGAFICAFLHGLGFSIFGYGSIKPRYWQRFMIQVLASIAGTVAIWVVGLLVTGTETGAKSFLDMLAVSGGSITGLLLLYAIISAVIVHLSISICCFYLFAAKGNLQAAIKTPIIISGLIFIVMFVPALLI